MKEIQKLILDFVEKHGDNMDVWIKSELGEIVGIDLSRNDLPAENPQQQQPTKVPYMAQYLQPAQQMVTEAMQSIKPFYTESDPAPLPGSFSEAIQRVNADAAKLAKEVDTAAERQKIKIEKELLGEELPREPWKIGESGEPEPCQHDSVTEIRGSSGGNETYCNQCLQKLAEPIEEEKE